MFNTETLWVAKLDYEKNWGIREHSHEFYQLYYIFGGEGTSTLDGRQIKLSSNNLMLIRPLEQHSLLKIKEGFIRMIDVKFKILDLGICELLSQIDFPFKCEDNEIFKSLEKLRCEWKSNEYLSNEMSEIHINEVIYSIIRGNEVKQKIMKAAEETMDLNRPDAVFYGLSRDISDYITNNFNKDFSLENLAKSLTYNKNYLCKIFKKNTTYTIMEYLNFVRIRQATKLICETDKKLLEISEEVGFKNIHHFNRVFKEIMNYTPGQIRTREKQSIYTDIAAHGRFAFRYYENE